MITTLVSALVLMLMNLLDAGGVVTLFEQKSDAYQGISRVGGIPVSKLAAGVKRPCVP